MEIVIRTDASIRIGSGHVMRCLTLASLLRDKGGEVSFISRELPGHLCDYIEEKGYVLFRLPEPKQNDGWLGISRETDAVQTVDILQQVKKNVDWLIVDHYGLDLSWEMVVRPYVRRIMVIDDLANRQHDCDLLLDQNLHNNLHLRYEGLVPSNCQKLLGPHYALLRPEFVITRSSLRKREGIVKRILIFFGGSDLSNETKKALQALLMLEEDLITDVVVGGSNPHKEEIRSLCLQIKNTNFHCQTENMAELMANADLAIGAGGSALWERCYLGLPSIVVVVADNQLEITNLLAKEGAILNLGWHHNVDSKELAKALKTILKQPDKLKTMSQNALRVVGNHSGANQVADVIMGWRDVATL